MSAVESLTTPRDFLDSSPPAMVAASRQPVVSPSPSPPSLGRKTSLIDLKDWVVADGTFPSPKRSSSSVSHYKSTTAIKKQSGERPVGSAPLIDLHSPPKSKPKPRPKPANLAGTPTAATKGQSPPHLPPRKPSHTSLKSAAAQAPQLNFLYPPRPQDSLPINPRLDPHLKGSGHAQSSSISSFHSVSLSSDTDTSSVSNFIATFPIERNRSSASANSGTNDIDSVSLTESFEEVSASSLTSPAEEKFEWQFATRKPPKLPERPASTNSKTSSQASQPRMGSLKAAGSGPSSPVNQPTLSRHSSVSTLNNAAPPYSPYTPRRAAPPPPRSRSSDRSSILSNATTQSFSSHSSHSHQQLPPLPGGPVVTLKTKRPTPVPLAARQRYEVVFVKNVLQQRKTQYAKENQKPSNGLLSPPSEVARNRRAAGWRGLSVDLIVDPEGPTTSQNQHDKSAVDEAVDDDEKLEGAIVRLIWKKSGLESTRLAEIWYVNLIFKSNQGRATHHAILGTSLI